MDTTIKYLKENGLKIGDAASDGDKQALQIINLYELHSARPSDPGAKGLLDAAVTEYRTSH